MCVCVVDSSRKSVTHPADALSRRRPALQPEEEEQQEEAGDRALLQQATARKTVGSTVAAQDGQGQTTRQLEAAASQGETHSVTSSDTVWEQQMEACRQPPSPSTGAENAGTD